MKKTKILSLCIMALMLVGTSFNVKAEEIGKSIFDYKENTVIVKNHNGIPYELKGYSSNYLEPKQRGAENFRYNGDSFDKASPGKTSAVWKDSYYINRGDKITYETKDNNIITISAITPIPDFIIYRENGIFGIQSVFGSFLDYIYPKTKINISSSQKTKGHITFKDIDYGENITINKSSLKYIGVSKNSLITYKETDTTITFYGKQGTKGSSDLDDNYWVTLFLNSNNIDLELKTSAGTVIGFYSEKVVELPENEGSVVANYVDEEGNVISDQVITIGNIGDPYSTEQKAIPGYTFKEIQGSASGQFTDKEQTITYVYTKDPVVGGNVTAKYVDGAGNTLSDNVVKSGNIGDDYSTEQKAIPGYTFKEVQGSASGQFTDKEQTVTYVYTKDPVVGGNVTAKYVDGAGNTLSDNVVKSGNIGDDYSTEQKAIPGYTFKEVQGSASGQFTDKEQTITYVYTKDPVAGANVTAKYVDENGKTISDDVVKNGNVGDSYTTEQKAIPGYTFKEIQGSASGQFTDKEQTVTYVYTKDPVVGGNVTAKYVDGAGNTLSDNVVKSGNIGDDYSTEQKAIPGYTFKEVQGSASGQFTDKEQTITYVYTKDPVVGGNVTAKYVDGAGNTLSDNVVKSGNIGDDYSTEQKAIPGYTFKEVQGSASGQFTDKEQTITYVYTKDPVAGANVTVKYVDGAGNTLSDNVVKSGNIGDDYSTEQKAIPGYTFKEIQGSASGQFTDKEQTITYVYTKDPVVGGNVTAKYVDGAGNTLSDNVVKSGNIGDDYSTEQKAIPGYTFKEVQGSASGQFTDKEQTVTYVYTKDPVVGGNVTAKYVDGAGNTLSDNVVKSGNIGDDYSTEQKAIPGYTFKEVQGSASGQFTDKEQTITYVYTKDPVAGANVTAKYVDENGKTISDDVVKNGNVGDSYTTEQKAIPGYTFKEIQGSASGQFTDKEQTVTYVYTKDPVVGGNVTAKYVDGAGNTLSDNVVKSGNIGDDYSTEQKAIPGYTFKEVQGSASGQFTDKEQTITYVYTKDPVVGGNVTAKYVDGAGNTLSDNVVKSGNIGDDYSTEQKAIPGYTFKEVQGSASGQFTDKEQTITYVYTKDPVAGANVTAKYVDENGKTISDDVVKNGNVGDSYTTEQKAIPGYTFKEIQGSASGQFTDKEQTVTYVYTKDPVVGGNVTAKYVDGAGNTLSDNVVRSGNIGDDYSTEQKAIPGYTFKEVQGSASGQFTDKEQTITYVYTKDPVAGANVTAKYVDENGKTISDDVVKNGNVGDSYTTEQKAIPGYTFKEIQGSASGQFTDKEQTVTYVYTKDPVAGANVTAKYVDENGKTISDDVVKNGNVGDSYTTEQKAIPGYTFKEIQGSASGQFTDKEQTVTYVYTKDPVVGGSVLVKYVDEAGNTLSDNVVKSGNIGDDYSTEQKAIPGYTFKEVQGSASGQFTDQEQTITYVYTKDPVAGANVTVKYVDGAGNTLSDNVVKSGNIGDDYSTEQKAIPGYTFKEVQGSASGQFTDKEQTITYVYTKDPVVGGNVTAKYVDGAGNTLSDNVVKSGNIGDDYSTEQKAFPGYTFKEVQGSASGQFTDKEQTITYVYTKNSVTPVKPTEPGTTQTNEKSLPTTGEKPANWAVVVGGLITLTAATVLYLLKRKY